VAQPSMEAGGDGLYSSFEFDRTLLPACEKRWPTSHCWHCCLTPLNPMTQPSAWPCCNICSWLQEKYLHFICFGSWV